MFGLLTLEEKGAARRENVACAVREIRGVRFLEARVVSGGALARRRRLRRAAKRMQRAGVRRAVFPENFSEMAIFEKRGVAAADEGLLRRKMAARIARRAMENAGLDPAECRVAVLGERMDADVRAALMELALRARFTMLRAGGGGGEACSVLRREYGVSVARDAGEALLKTAQVVLTFGAAQPCGAPGCLWIPCGSVRAAEGYENAAPAVRYAAGPETEAALAGAPHSGALLSLLFELGAVRAEELEIIEIAQNA